jgi:hypothetical protein
MEQTTTETHSPVIHPSKHRRIITSGILLVICFLAGAGFIAYQKILLKQQVSITTYEACIKAPGSMLQTSYPATCVTRGGKQFTQPFSDEERGSLKPPTPKTPKSPEAYTCPSNGWVDCMPGPQVKPECTPEAMSWYKTNCPNFKGGAL